MYNFQDFLEQLNNGFEFEFDYMGKQCIISSFDKETYTVIKYNNDNNSKRKERKIISKHVLKEMFNEMQNITYIY